MSGREAQARLSPVLRVGLLLVALLLVLGGTMPYFEGLLDGNERPRLLAGIAFVEEGSMRVDGPWSAGVPVGPDVALAADGVTRVPNKPPGATLVAALVWWVLDAVGGILGSAPTLRAYTIGSRLVGGLLPTVVLATLLWRHERAWAVPGEAAEGRGARALARADFALLAWLLATPAWSNAKLLFGHSLAACFLGCGVVVLVGRPGRPRTPTRAALGGALAGTAVLVEYTAAFAGPVIGVWLLWRERGRWPTLVGAAGGALVPIFALGTYHQLVFGSPWTTGYHRVVREEFSAIHGRGLLGLQFPSAHSLFEHLLSPWGGLLVWAPLCLLAILAGLHAGLHSGARDARGETSPEAARALLFAGTAFALLLVLVGLEQGGGWRVGPRYFVLAMPLCVPGTAALIKALDEAELPLGWSLVFGLFVAACLGNFLAANWFPHLIPHGNPVGDLLLPLTALRPHGISPWLVAAAATVLVGLACWQLRTTRRGPSWPWFAGLTLGLALFAFQMIGPASDPGAELELEAIETLWEPREGTSPRSPPSRELGQ